ncbi:MAG: helix-turn-helix transcriptional regulator [Betaproteobacteria bacterium]|nr:MAG: helix-turn-helix transcriptional regulator [Betaproteobacteria bacterium]
MNASAYIPLIKTKIATPPLRPHTVVRQRLLELLEEAVTRPLTLVSAPAGFGKTTLITSWLNETGRDARTAWLSVDADDSDPVHFVYYLTATLQAVEPRVGRAPIFLLGSLKMPGPVDLVSLLLNEIAEAEEPLVLVLDDYHTVSSDEVNPAVASLVERMPEKLRLVICTREEPSLPLARWRSLERVFDVGVEQLRFSYEEAVVFFRQTMGLDIDAKAARTLEARTEGWIAALQMAALSMRLHGKNVAALPAAEVPSTFSARHRYLVDYLASEVLKGQSDETRALLHRTSILDRLCAPLCNALTGRTDGEAQLARLDQRNMFLVPLDDDRQWYRYHQLFADYLRSGVSPDEKRELHLIASAWFETNGFGEEAIRHALAAEDIDASVRLIRAQSENTLARGQIPTVLSWLRELPESALRANPDLAGYKAWLLYMRGQSAEAESYAALARSDVKLKGPTEHLGKLLSFQAFLALNWSDPQEAIPLAEQALQRLGDEASFFHAYVLCMMGQAQSLTRDRRAAVITLRKAVALAKQLGNRFMAFDALGHLAIVLNAQGQLREAILLCREAADEAVDSEDHPLPIAGLVHIPLGALQYEADDLPSARLSLVTGINLCEQLGMVYFKVVGKCALAKLQHTGGEVNDAWSTLAAAREVSDRPESPRRQRLVAATTAELQLREGNLEAAARTLEDARNLVGLPLEQESILRARLLLAQRSPSAAWKILSALEESALRQRSDGSLIAIHILQALCKRSLNQPTGAQEYLLSAVSLAATAGYRRLFLDEGANLTPMLEQARHVAPAFVQSLLEPRTPEQGVRPAGPLVERLGKIEVEILGLLDKGMTNQEIADRLAMTVGTTKWRMNQIFGKLQVRNRIEALARARQLRLL